MKTTTCDRCDRVSPPLDLGYVELDMGVQGWDLCGPCASVVRETVTDRTDYRRMTVQISNTLSAAGVDAVGLSLPARIQGLVVERDDLRKRLADKIAEQPVEEVVTGEEPFRFASLDTSSEMAPLDNHHPKASDWIPTTHDGDGNVTWERRSIESPGALTTVTIPFGSDDPWRQETTD